MIKNLEKYEETWKNVSFASHVTISSNLYYKFDGGLILTGDVAYTKDINGTHVQNWGLLPPSETLGGVDNRPIYSPNDLINNAYVMTNSDKGRTWNASLKHNNVNLSSYVCTKLNLRGMLSPVSLLDKSTRVSLKSH